MSMRDCVNCKKVSDMRGMRSCRQCGASICATCSARGGGYCSRCRDDSEE